MAQPASFEDFADTRNGREHDPLGLDAAGGLGADGGHGLEVRVGGRARRT